MLGKKNSKSWASNTTLIAGGTEIKGDICFRGHLEIEGTIVGNISAVPGEKAVVRVMSEGCVIGEIDAPIIVLNGKVEGDVFSTEHLELAEKALVEGNVHYNMVEMVRGAEVNGNLVHRALNSSSAKDSGDTNSGASITDGTVAAST